jgi:hypothetical protein
MLSDSAGKSNSVSYRRSRQEGIDELNPGIRGKSFLYWLTIYVVCFHKLPLGDLKRRNMSIDDDERKDSNGYPDLVPGVCNANHFWKQNRSYTLA